MRGWRRMGEKESPNLKTLACLKFFVSVVTCVFPLVLCRRIYLHDDDLSLPLWPFTLLIITTLKHFHVKTHRPRCFVEHYAANVTSCSQSSLARKNFFSMVMMTLPSTAPRFCVLAMAENWRKLSKLKYVILQCSKLLLRRSYSVHVHSRDGDITFSLWSLLWSHRIGQSITFEDIDVRDFSRRRTTTCQRENLRERSKLPGMQLGKVDDSSFPQREINISSLSPQQQNQRPISLAPPLTQK